MPICDESCAHGRFLARKLRVRPGAGGGGPRGGRQLGSGGPPGAGTHLVRVASLAKGGRQRSPREPGRSVTQLHQGRADRSEHQWGGGRRSGGEGRGRQRGEWYFLGAGVPPRADLSSPGAPGGGGVPAHLATARMECRAQVVRSYPARHGTFLRGSPRAPCARVVAPYPHSRGVESIPRRPKHPIPPCISSSVSRN